MGIPNGSSIFQLRSDKCTIYHLPQAWMFNFDISPELRVFVALPVTLSIWEHQATGDINPKIPGTGNSFQDVAMETILCIIIALIGFLEPVT